MTTPAEEFVIDTAQHVRPVAPDAPVRIGGHKMMARCPKGQRWLDLIVAEAGQDADKPSALEAQRVVDFVQAVFSKEDTEAIQAMLDDDENREVDAYAMGEVYVALLKFWLPHVEKYLVALNDVSSQDMTTGRPAAKKAPRKLAAIEPPKGPAKKTAKKTAAKKSAARKR